MTEQLERSREAERIGEWQITERFEAPKNPQKGTEDGVIVSPECIAVLDGVSSGESTVRINGKTPGQFAVVVGRRALQEAARLKNERDIVPYVTRAVKEALRQNPNEGIPAFVFVAFFPTKNLLIRVGDCSYLLDGSGKNPGLKVDEVKGIVRKRQLAGVPLEEVLQDDPSRVQIHELTQLWQPHFKNRADDPVLGYAVVDGSEIPDSLIEYVPVPSETKSIVLASDGYHPSILRVTLEETERDLAEMIKKDPTGLSFNASKNVEPVPDDRTYLRLIRSR